MGGRSIFNIIQVRALAANTAAAAAAAAIKAKEQSKSAQAQAQKSAPQRSQESTTQLSTSRKEVLAFASVLKQCSIAKDVARGELVRARIEKQGFGRNLFLGNWLVQMYGDCGCMDKAQAVFDSFLNPNLHSWTILMRAYVRNERAHEALECFSKMQEDGMKGDPHAFVVALDACASLGNLRQGQEIEAAVVESGCEEDVIVGTALVNMYGKCKALHHAVRVFSRMPERNVVTWNAVITACSQNGDANNALNLFQQMQYLGFLPDVVALVCALDACGELALLSEGRQMHAAVIEKGFEGDIVVGNALVSMYGRCKSLSDAENVFWCMPRRNVVSWNTMISAFVQNGLAMKALEMFYSMDSCGMRPNQVTFLCVLDACAGIANLCEGQKIHAAIGENKCETDVLVGNALINMYGKCKSLRVALEVFDQMPQRNLVSWNTIISVCTQSNYFKEALNYYDQMQNTGIKPNEITFLGALDACSKLGILEKGREIHSMIIDGGYEGLIILENSLVYMYGQCKALQDARSVFDQMWQRDVISWNSIISACTRNGQDNCALEYFDSMQCHNVRPNEITFVCALDACTNLAMLEKGQEIHGVIVKCGFEGQTIVGTALLNMYGKCGKLQNATEVFGQLPKRDIVCWNAMIAACAQNGHDKEALDLFKRMLSDGVKPNETTFLAALTACSHVGRVDDGRQLFTSMRLEHGIICTVEHYKCMVDIFGRAGCLDEAENLIRTMPFQEDAGVWLCLLAACKLHGDVERGVRAAGHIFELNSDNAAPYVLLSNVYASANENVRPL